jgi:hypothetical protein
MTPPPTIRERIAALPPQFAPAHSSRAGMTPLPVPPYHAARDRYSHIFLAYEPFQRHMTDEGNQLQIGLEHAGYSLWGRRYDNDETDVDWILTITQPQVCIVQDKREWDPASEACLDKSAAFTACEALRDDPACFKLTILKDAHNDPAYHRAAAEEIGCHAWITYYHPEVVAAVAPYVRREHLIRTWHSLEPAAVPAYSPDRRSPLALLSGAATRDLYPFRWRLKQNAKRLPVEVLQHPGYHARGSHTPAFLQKLSQHRVAICTCSAFGYSLRKLIEAVACGCVVITDLPPDEVLPGGIDEALVRVHPDVEVDDLTKLIQRCSSEYDSQRQREFARLAIEWYDWRERGRELAEEIERVRGQYGV